MLFPVQQLEPMKHAPLCEADITSVCSTSNTLSRLTRTFILIKNINVYFILDFDNIFLHICNSSVLGIPTRPRGAYISSDMGRRIHKARENLYHCDNGLYDLTITSLSLIRVSFPI